MFLDAQSLSIDADGASALPFGAQAYYVHDLLSPISDKECDAILLVCFSTQVANSHAETLCVGECSAANFPSHHGPDA